MAVVAAIETADYKNFKMLCAYVNQARGYLLLLRKELGEVPSVSYSPINWFSRVNLNLYAKDPAMDGNDPILADMEGVTLARESRRRDLALPLYALTANVTGSEEEALAAAGVALASRKS